MVLSLGLSLVFFASSIPKLRHPRGFMLTVMDYHILPASLARVYARLLPNLELLIALVLLTGADTQLASELAALLLLSFIVGVGTNVAKGRELDCGCFGRTGGRRVGRLLLLEDVALLVASITLAVLSRPTGGLELWSVFRLMPSNRLSIAVPVLVSLALTICISASANRRRRSPPAGVALRAGHGSSRLHERGF